MPKLAAVLVTCLLAIRALADEPLKSVDTFEADVRRCLALPEGPECLGKSIGGHFPPGSERANEVVPEVVEQYRKWLGEDRIWGVHRVVERKRGEFFEERLSMLEDTGGNRMLVETAFITRKGKWYLFRFNISTKQETIEQKLGIRL